MGWTRGQIVTLETSDYFLRSLGETDATDRYLSWLKDAEVNKYVQTHLQYLSIKSIRDFIRSHDNRTSFLLGIFSKVDLLHVGNYSVRWDSNHGTAMIGQMIGDRDFWGRRVVLETRAAVLDFLFEVLDVVKVWGGPYSNNLASIYNYKAQGFQVEAILKSQFVSEGKRVDWISFAMFREDWLGRKR